MPHDQFQKSDYGFIKAMARELLVRNPEVDVTDAIRISKSLLNELPNYTTTQKGNHHEATTSNKRSR